MKKMIVTAVVFIVLMVGGMLDGIYSKYEIIVRRDAILEYAFDEFSEGQPWTMFDKLWRVWEENDWCDTRWGL